MGTLLTSPASPLQMFRRRANGALRRSDSQQAVKSPPLLVSASLPLWGDDCSMLSCGSGTRARGVPPAGLLPRSCSLGMRKRWPWRRP